MKRLLILLFVATLMFSCEFDQRKVYTGTMWWYVATKTGDGFSDGEITVELAFKDDTLFYRHGFQHRSDPRFSYSYKDSERKPCEKIGENEYLVEQLVMERGDSFHHIILEPSKVTEAQIKTVIKRIRMKEGVADTFQYTKPFFVESNL